MKAKLWNDIYSLVGNSVVLNGVITVGISIVEKVEFVIKTLEQLNFDWVDSQIVATRKKVALLDKGAGMRSSTIDDKLQ